MDEPPKAPLDSDWIDIDTLLAWSEAAVQWMREASAEIARVREAEAEAERDAARYRWLRGGPDVPPYSLRWSWWEVREWKGGYWNTPLGDDMDRAIDAAMA